MRFQHQVVVVTGAAHGIGFAAASRFAKEGARVVVHDLEPAAVDESVKRIQAQGGEAFGVACDVSDDGQVRRSVEKILETTGHVDVLVNNAGTYAVCTATNLDPRDWRRVLAVNLDGVFSWCQAVAVRSMIPRRQGIIVNVSSGAGVVGIPRAPAYVASKHGVVGLTKALAVEWGQYNIRINAVGPGLTFTGLVEAGRAQNPAMFAERERRIPLGHGATPDEQASVILFLASSDASAVHGHLLIADGGTAAMSSGYSVPFDHD